MSTPVESGAQEIPPGFERHFRRSALTEPWEPLWSKRERGVVLIGFRAAPAHCNSRGFVHGGLLATLADNAMGLSCGEGFRAKDAAFAGLVTISLQIDFISTARVGQWVQVEPEVLRSGARISFAQALVTAEGRTCARASASFSLLERSIS